MAQEFVHCPITNGVDLWYHRRDVVKRVLIRVTLHDALDPSRAGANAMVAAMMRRGTAKLPSVAQLSQACDDLYGAAVGIGVQKLGLQNVLSVTMRFPSPAYVPQGGKNFTKALSLLHDLIFDPMLNSEAYTPEVFASEQSQILRAIDQLKDNRGGYAMMRARQCALPDSPIGVPEFGSREAVEALTPTQLKRAWQRLAERAKISVHLAGNFDPKRHVAPLAEVFAAHPRQKQLRLPKPFVVGAVDKSKRSHEKIEGEQTHTVLLMTTERDSAAKDWAALRLANCIYGRDASSRLFRELREGLGLAYTINSQLAPTSGLMTVYAGTDKDQAKAAEDGSKRILKELQKNGFAESELATARQTLIEETLASADSLKSLVARHLSGEMRGRHQTLEEIETGIRAATAEQVHQAMKLIRPLYSYRLGP